MKTPAVALLLFLIGFVGLPAQTPPPPSPVSDASSDVPAKIDPAKEVEIRKMLTITGTAKLMDQMVDKMTESFRTTNSGVSDEFWARFKSEMDSGGLIEKIIPVYDKYYSLDDLKAVNAFYASPAGQRVLSSTPQVMAESMAIGQRWGMEVGSKLSQELEQEKKKKMSSAK